MGRILIKNAVDRKKGFLYYIDSKGNVCETQMARSGMKKKVVKKAKKGSGDYHGRRIR